MQKRMTAIYILIVAIGLLLANEHSLAGTLEAKKDAVEVYASADKGSSVLKTLKKGEEIASGERSGMYWQVKLADGKPGFVSVLAVKIKSEGTAGLSDALRGAVKSGRETSEQTGGRARSAVMGVRGLDDNNTAMAGSVRPNLRAVYSMEDFDVGAAKLEQQSAIIENDIMGRMRK